MTKELHERLKNWARSVVPEADVCLAAPGEYVDRRLIGMRLLDLFHEPRLSAQSISLRGGRQIALRFWVQARAEDKETEICMLENLAFATFEEPDFELGPQPLAETLINGINTPCFLLKVHLRREPAQATVPRVRKPAEITYSQITSLAGVVLTADDVPLSGVRIELPALKRVTHADTKGRFRFAHVPVEPPVKQLRILAKGQEYLFEADQKTIANQPLIIRFDTPEV